MYAFIKPYNFLLAVALGLLFTQCREKNIHFEPTLVFVQGDTCSLGNPARPARVEDFCIGKYEVTQAEWKNVMGDLPKQGAYCDDCPVGNVNWNDAQQFIQKINRATGKTFRLPTREEWEFAAKGGIFTHYLPFSGSAYLNLCGWTSSETQTVMPVGQKRANEIGCCDMSGNVREWTASPFESSPAARYIKGGSVRYDGQMADNTNNDWLGAAYTDLDIGFRLAIDASQANAAWLIPAQRPEHAVLIRSDTFPMRGIVLGAYIPEHTDSSFKQSPARKIDFQCIRVKFQQKTVRRFGLPNRMTDDCHLLPKVAVAAIDNTLIWIPGQYAYEMIDEAPVRLPEYAFEWQNEAYTLLLGIGFGPEHDAQALPNCSKFYPVFLHHNASNSVYPVDLYDSTKTGLGYPWWNLRDDDAGVEKIYEVVADGDRLLVWVDVLRKSGTHRHLIEIRRERGRLSGKTSARTPDIPL
jgi:hypothetical protein